MGSGGISAGSLYTVVDYRPIQGGEELGTPSHLCYRNLR